ncbi:energy transducer TonB [Mucilaginibacter sp.]|uniref:energy transducer TonB n=1 Tax=Mucilaginibacter sp. TaxID=1882438 RepID=UPI0025F2D8C2|nr:energy transducer TonB [Mucilaginibacter sp.]
MKIILLCMGLLSGLGVSAQTTRKIVDNEDLNIREKYYVLKTDKQTKQGKYQAFSLFGDRLICEGYYKNNLKDSLWTFYSLREKPIETGLYKDGEKTGIWKGLNADGTVNVEYDFTNNNLMYFQPNKADTGKFKVISGADTTKRYVDRPPIYLDGVERFWAVMITGMRYPASARTNGVQGKVIVAFTINERGGTSDYYIKHSIGADCDQEALKAVKRAGGYWLPAILNGKQVAVEYQVPISFTMGN